MTIRGCSVVAIDGTYGSGKSTLVAALVGELRAQSWNVGGFPENARQNPFLEEAIVLGAKPLDVVAELHILCSHISAELNTARHHEILICDASALNVLAHVEALLDREEQEQYRGLVDAMRGLASAYARQYDSVLYLTDRFAVVPGRDQYRLDDEATRARLDHALRALYVESRVELTMVPPHLSLRERIAWVMNQMFPAIAR